MIINLFCIYQMKAETVRRRLRPYIGDVVDNCCIVPNRDVDKYQHLLDCIKLTKNYPEILLYLDVFLRKFTFGELNGINFNGEQIFTAIYFNKLGFDSKIFELLIQHGADINLPNIFGLTPLARAITSVYICGYEERIIKLFFENGADVNQEFTYCKKKYTALTYILGWSHRTELSAIKIIKLLLDHGAIVDSDNIDKLNTTNDIKIAIIEHCDKLSSKYTKLAN